MEKTFTINGQEIKVQNYLLNGNALSFELNGKTYSYTMISKNGPEMILDNGNRFTAAVGTPTKDGDSMIFTNGKEAIGFGTGKKLKKAGAISGGLVSPMPGKIFKILKEEGSIVKKGEAILILEAMKMEHSIRSDKDGKVKKVFYKVGELVQGGVTLAEVSA